MQNISKLGKGAGQDVLSKFDAYLYFLVARQSEQGNSASCKSTLASINNLSVHKTNVRVRVLRYSSKNCLST